MKNKADKMFILVFDKRGQVGYIKSISYKNHTFKVTSTKYDAKAYSSIEKVHSELDFLSEFVIKGYNFQWV